MTILDELKHHTQELHDRVEQRMQLLREELTLEEYRATLERLYGFYLPLEERLAAAFREEETGFDAETRRKTPLLARDLRALGEEPEWAALPVCGNLPEVSSPAAAFGCAYVLEGATLGGQVISRHLDRTLGLGPETGTAFFHSYGPEVGARWRAFRQSITNYVTTPPRAESALRAARDTFRSFERWVIDRQHP